MKLISHNFFNRRILKIARVLFTISPLLVLTMYTWNDLSITAKSLPPAQFKHQLEKCNGVLVDVRTPEQYNSECIAGAININVQADDFKSRIENLNKSEAYFLYCGTGKRSAKAMEMMLEAGFKKVYDLKGGLTEWKKKGFPIAQPKL